MMKKYIAVFGIVMLTTLLAGCAVSGTPTDVVPLPTDPVIEQGQSASSETISEFTFRSEAFEQADSIPEKYTCDGEDVSTELRWEHPPAGTQTFVLIMDDPDAPGGTWVHWVVYNLPEDIRDLPSGKGTDSELPDPAEVGENSWGQQQYGGPCPPSGTHRYFFTLYAIDQHLEIGPGATGEAVQTAIEGHVLESVELVGTYSR